MIFSASKWFHPEATGRGSGAALVGERKARTKQSRGHCSEPLHVRGVLADRY